ncbi:MAG: rhomboid family intramembrane serine protease [Planctomycetota bacterium]|jgi:membrane associated rhomboid family serine protease
MPEIEHRMEIALPTPRKLFTPVVTVMIVLMIIGFALINHAKEFTINYLAVNPQTCFPFRLWQLVTYSFINLCAWNMIFDGLIIIFIGSAIEREWRSVSFLLLMLTVSIVCGAIWLLVNLAGNLNYLGWGTGACAYGLIAAFGLLFRRKRFFALFWTIEAQHLALLLIAIGLIVGIAQPISWVWVGGAGVAYLYIKLRLRMASPASGSRATGEQRRHGDFVDLD